MLPVLAQAARRAPTMRACVNAAVMPLSLKLPDGFIPSYCRQSVPGFMPTYCGHGVGRWQSVCPSPIVMMRSSGANGNSSRNRQTPEKSSGSMAVGPLRLEIGERLRHRQPVPVVGDVEQPAALRALERGVAEVGRAAAIRPDTPLKCQFAHRLINLREVTWRFTPSIPRHAHGTSNCQSRQGIRPLKKGVLRRDLRGILRASQSLPVKTRSRQPGQ